MTAIPFIDIFAGPGGLSEGFSRFASFKDSDVGFEGRLAIEKDEVAARTLELRSFFRTFPSGEAPEEYYQVVRGQRSVDTLAQFPEWHRAKEHVWCATLGEIPEAQLHSRIAARLEGTSNWVLLGGPPCQAYSLMGRARMTGVGAAAREQDLDLDVLRQTRHEKFAEDHRHRLYREYLRIVAVHQPAVFVMENVKGILSSRLRNDETGQDEPAFARIREDLTDPWEALVGDPELALLQDLRSGAPRRYKLYSLASDGDRSDGALKDTEFLIRSEDFGVPQKRHRVILLGVREDLDGRPTSLRRSDSKKTVEDAIGDFPRLRSGLSKGDSDWPKWVREIRSIFAGLGSISGFEPVNEAIAGFIHNYDTADEVSRGNAFVRCPIPNQNSELYRWFADPNLGGFIQHEARAHMTSDLARYLYAAATAQHTGTSPKLEEWPPQLLPKHRNVRHDETTGTIRADGFSDRFKVQVWGEPSSTVTSHIAKDGHYFIHPDPTQCRSLTVREAARLQTFPDNYFFCGNRTQQYHQVGNAVPPYLACQIAAVVAGLMEDAGLAGGADG